MWGGVVAEFFRGPQKPTRFGGGGVVVVAAIFRDLHTCAMSTLYPTFSDIRE